MYLSPDVGSRAPRGLAWGPSTRAQDRESLVTLQIAYSGGKQATEESLFVDVAELPYAFVTFSSLVLWYLKHGDHSPQKVIFLHRNK